jgi:peptide deformylase
MMAVRSILLYKNNPAALRRKSETVPSLDRRARRLIRDLKETLLASADGIGLAAPQINVHSRVVVVRLGGGRAEREPHPPFAMVNPMILDAGDVQPDFDGCLSFPGLYGETLRPHFLRVAGLDEKGSPFVRALGGFDAVVVHHEIDHLEGILFIDRAAGPEDLYYRVQNDRGETVRLPFGKDTLEKTYSFTKDGNL